MLKTTKLITTNNFKLATYQKGSPQSNKLAIILPGRSDTKDYPHMRSHVDFLATKGYFALSFDPPGTWESEGDISIYSTTNYLKAVKEVIEYYGNKPTLLVGHSRGGSMAILAGTRINEVEAFISIMGRASYKTKAFIDGGWKEDGFHISKRDTPKEYAEREKSFKLSFAFVEDSQQYDMIPDLKICNKPKLFIAGSKDVLVDPMKIKQACELSAEPKQFIMLESEHDYRLNDEMIKKVNTLIEDFIQKSS
ncbi:MAG: alpha/beta hydrolase [Nanoarchaeota archaeon]|nr:alpha/beta hydrolase [Nanoarchaeota archaeon]